MLINKDAYQRETLAKWPVRLLRITLVGGIVGGWESFALPER